MSQTLKVNGKSHTVDVDPSTPLLYILRNDLGLQGPRIDRVFGPYKKGPRSFCRSTAAKSVRGLGLVSRFYHPRNPRFKTKNARFDILWKERVFVPSPDVGSVSSSRN